MINALKGLSINTEKNLETSDMISSFDYHLLKKKDIIKSKEYTLLVSNAEIASKVFVQLENIDISNSYVYKLDHSEIENIKIECKTKAIENGKRKALAMTKPLGQNVGNAINITEIENIATEKTSEIRYRGKDMLAEIPKVDFKKIRISAMVNIKFTLK